MRLTRSDLGDLALAAVLAVVGMFGTLATDAMTAEDRPVDAAALVLVLATAGMLVLRRRRPLLTLAVVTVSTSAFLVVEYPYGPILFSFAVAVYSVARHRALTVAGPAALVALPVLLSHVLTHDGAAEGLGGFAALVPGTAWVAVPFAAGVTVRVNREAAAQARAEALRRSVYDERLRVAQEVHDVVGHGLAAIKMQADVALHVLARKPEQAEEALRAISRTSTEALDELRATLSLVRERPVRATGAVAEDDHAERAPVPGLARLEELRRRMEEAGLRVAVTVTGERRELSPKVDLVAYRVVQESLTNVLKHGELQEATVRLDYGDDAVVLWIHNPLTDTATLREGGLGIAGMRERVTSVGGDFRAGAARDGGFEVRAVLPTGGGS